MRTWDRLMVSFVWLMLLGATVFFVEMLFFWLWYQERVDFYIFPVIHTIFVGFATFYTWQSGSLRFGFLAPLLILILGPYGGEVIFISALFFFMRHHRTVTFEEFYNDLFSITKKEGEQSFDEIENALSDFSSMHSHAAFGDVMEFGTIEQKGVAIAKILAHFRPNLSSALIKGLHDNNPIVRVRAATAVAKLQDQILKKTEEWHRKIAEFPEDFFLQKGYAEHLESTSTCLFIDQERRVNMKKEAIRAYELYLEKHPEDTRAWIAVAWLYLDTGCLDDAKMLFEAVVEEKGITSTHLLLGYLKTLFDLREYESIRQITSQGSFHFIDANTDEGVRVKDLVDLWAISSAAG